MNNKSAAQILFDRLVTTWIIPEIEYRAGQELVTLPFNLKAALILWENLNQPRVLLNDEVNASIVELQVNTVEPVSVPINPSLIQSLGSIRLIETVRDFPFIFLIQADNGKFYALSKKMSRVIQTREFEILQESLATEGVYLTPNEYEMQVFLDFTRNYYDNLSSPVLKRKETIRLAKTLVDSVQQTATARVKRHLKLPPFLVHQDDEFLPLLLETRQTYIDGYFFSCIASAATTADRLCIRLSQHYELPNSLQKWILDQTLGNKIPKLRAEGVIRIEQEELLSKINRIRNRHIHPKKSTSIITLKRDAFKAILLLHQLLEGTFSVYRDYTIAQGRIVPKPFV